MAETFTQSKAKAQTHSAKPRPDDSLARRVRELTALYVFTDNLQRAGSLEEIYESALDSILIALNCQRASILLFDEQAVMQFVASRGLSEPYRKAVSGHSPWTADVKDPQPIYISDTRTAELQESLRAVIITEGLRALGFIPLVANRKLIGKFMTYYDQPHRFTVEEQEVALTIARQLGFGIERKRADQALRESEARYRTLAEQVKDYAANLESLVAERTRDLKATNEQLEAFVYSIAHDLRAPLRTITGYSQLLAEDHASRLDETGRHLLQRMLSSSEFMDKLLLDLLAFGRTARAPVELGPVEVQKAWQAALLQCSTQIEQAQAHVESAPPEAPVIAHEATLGQCLANLLSNALKFVPPGVTPHVRFWGEERDGWIRLWVEDNGLGIPSDQHERVFRVFERLQGSRYPGTGIGLSIVRKGVERMGGTVGVESQPGRGSRFWIELRKAN